MTTNDFGMQMFPE